MKKIPIMAAISIFFLVVILMPSLGVTWRSYFEPTGNPNECYVQKENGDLEPCKIEAVKVFLWPSQDTVQDCDMHCQEFAQTKQTVFTGGVTEIINPNHRSLTYHKTTQVIDDTYLGKNVKQWQDSWDFDLESSYNQYGDEFFSKLGALLIKNEMQNQMNALGIVNVEDDFEVASGMALASLPPHIGFSSVIHATDGHYYWLQGGTHSNKVSYYKTTQLQYPDETMYPKIDSIISKGLPRVSITEDGNDLLAKPSYVVLAERGKIEFFNYATETLTVYLDQEETNDDIVQELSTKSSSGMTIPFNSPGVYSFNAEVLKNINGNRYWLDTGGVIVVLSEDMSNLPMSVKMEISKMILSTSGLPIFRMGQGEQDGTIYIDLDPAIDILLPESRQYYLDAAQSIIPFEIRIGLY